MTPWLLGCGTRRPSRNPADSHNQAPQPHGPGSLAGLRDEVCVDVGFSGEGFRLALWASAEAMGSLWAFFEGLIH